MLSSFLICVSIGEVLVVFASLVKAASVPNSKGLCFLKITFMRLIN